MIDIRSITGMPGAVTWLHLAAAPTFAVMTLLTGLGGEPMNVLCASGHMASVNGMTAMYLLMSIFHLPPWLRLRLNRHPTAGLDTTSL